MHPQRRHRRGRHPRPAARRRGALAGPLHAQTRPASPWRCSGRSPARCPSSGCASATRPSARPSAAGWCATRASCTGRPARSGTAARGCTRTSPRPSRPAATTRWWWSAPACRPRCASPPGPTRGRSWASATAPWRWRASSSTPSRSSPRAARRSSGPGWRGSRPGAGRRREAARSGAGAARTRLEREATVIQAALARLIEGHDLGRAEMAAVMDEIADGGATPGPGGRLPGRAAAQGRDGGRDRRRGRGDAPPGRSGAGRARRSSSTPAAPAATARTPSTSPPPPPSWWPAPASAWPSTATAPSPRAAARPTCWRALGVDVDAHKETVERCIAEVRHRLPLRAAAPPGLQGGGRHPARAGHPHRLQPARAAGQPGRRPPPGDGRLRAALGAHHRRRAGRARRAARLRGARRGARRDRGHRHDPRVRGAGRRGASATPSCPRTWACGAGTGPSWPAATPRRNAAILRDVLAGQQGAPRDAVLVNAAAALVARRRRPGPAGRACRWRRDSIDSGAARGEARPAAHALAGAARGGAVTFLDGDPGPQARRGGGAARRAARARAGRPRARPAAGARLRRGALPAGRPRPRGRRGEAGQPLGGRHRRRARRAGAGAPLRGGGRRGRLGAHRRARLRRVAGRPLGGAGGGGAAAPAQGLRGRPLPAAGGPGRPAPTRRCSSSPRCPATPSRRLLAGCEAARPRRAGGGARRGRGGRRPGGRGAPGGREQPRPQDLSGGPGGRASGSCRSSRPA